MANQTASAIRDTIHAYLASHSTVKYVVLIGGDDVVPQMRVPDGTVVGNERGYVDDSYLRASSPQFASLFDSMVLTDDPYVTWSPIPYNGHSLYIPDVAVSRLVETPEEIAGVIGQYESSNGLLPGGSAVVTGQDFMANGAQRVADILGSYLTGTPAVTLEPLDTWTAADLKDDLFNGSADLGDINAHFVHYGGITASGYNLEQSGQEWRNEFLSSTDFVPSEATGLTGKLVFSMGCHAGLNAPDTRIGVGADETGRIDPRLDIAQAIALQKGVLVASTGFGFGDTETVAGTEALIGTFADEATTAGADTVLDGNNVGPAQSIGLALAAAKRDYLGSLSTMTPYDEKSSIQFTMYGMPQYRLVCKAHQPNATTSTGVNNAASASFSLRGFQQTEQEEALVPAIFELYIDDGTPEGRTVRATLDEVAGSDGSSRYITADGRDQATSGKPIQPRLVVDLGSEGDQPVKSVIVTGGTYVDIPDFDPAISRWTHEWEQGAQERQVATDGWWPANLTTLSTIVTIMASGDVDSRQQRLIVLPAQFMSTSAPGETVTGIERVWTSLDVELVRLPEHATPEQIHDTIAPTVRSVTLTKAGDTVTAKVDASDENGISSIEVVHTGDDGTTTYSFPSDLKPDLTKNADGTYHLSFDLPGVDASDVSLTVFVTDGAGNTTTKTGKGASVEMGVTQTVTASAGANGAISPDGVTIFGEGGSQEYTITPAANYHLLDLTLDGASVLTEVAGPDGDGTYGYTLAAVDADHELVATFAIDEVALTGSMSVNGGAETTYRPVVTIESQVPGATEMQTSTDGVSWSAWRPYAERMLCMLPGSSGESQQIWVKYRDVSHRQLELGGAITRSFVSVAGGGGHSLAITRDKWRLAWGENLRGQIGNDSSDDQLTPLRYGEPQDRAIAAGGAHSLAVAPDGHLTTWGANDTGQLGDGTTDDQHWYSEIGFENTWLAVTAGDRHSLALKSDDLGGVTLWAWGSDDHGALGNGTEAGQLSPAPIGTGADWMAISAGVDYSLGLMNDGTLWAWGRNDHGQLGDGTTDDRQDPASIGSGHDWVAVDCGDRHSLGLKSDGTLWAWGDDTRGQLGGTNGDPLKPGQIGTESDWVAIAAGALHSIALKSDGTLWSWGADDSGQLGNGPEPATDGPAQVGSDDDWVAIACGANHSLAVKDDNDLWAWGDNSSGQLGDGTRMGSPAPKRIINLVDFLPPSVSIESPADGATIDTATPTLEFTVGGDATSVVIRVDDAIVIKASGDTLDALAEGSHTLTVRAEDAAGNARTATSMFTVAVPPPTGTMTLNGGAAETYSALAVIDSTGIAHATQMRTSTDETNWSDWRDIADRSVVALPGLPGTTTVYVRYRNAAGQVLERQADVTRRAVPVAAGERHVLALRGSGLLWAWGGDPGANTYGQLGDGSYLPRTGPGRIGTDGDWATVAAGEGHSLALKADGTLWAWGYNAQGQIGDGSLTNRSTPISIGGGTAWAAVAAGARHSVALKADGTLWTWGLNTSGQLGDGTTADRDEPTQIGADTHWTASAAGSNFTLALKDDGRLYAWGQNSAGQLGLGNYEWPSTPTQVGYDADWVAIAASGSHAAALKMDGTLWTWGANGYGQLGDGTAENRRSPVQVGGGHVWTQIAAGPYNGYAVEEDGELWTWGDNSGGQLGDGTQTPRSTPAPASGTGWLAVAAGNSHALGYKSDGRVWTWGGDACVGNGTTANWLSPVRIGGNAPWTAVASGRYWTLALDADGGLWSWGYNDSTGLGDGYDGYRSAPVRIGTDTWSKIAAGFDYRLAIKSNGTLWAWGNNNIGQLGDGTQTTRTTPVQIGTENDWAGISAGWDHTLALKTDGTLYTWGDNGWGQLGVPAAGSWSSAAVVVPSPAAGRSWAAMAAAEGHSLGLLDDGSLWAWGRNVWGDLGDGTTVSRNAPVRVGNPAWVWKAIAANGYHNLAIRSDGTLWGWGYNGYGQVGDGTTNSPVTAPVQISSASDWVAIGCGRNHSMAVNENDEVYAWGYNGNGQLGDATTDNRSSPVLVATAGVAVSGGEANSAVLAADGTISACGQGSSGVLGDGTMAHRLTFVPVFNLW